MKCMYCSEGVKFQDNLRTGCHECEGTGRHRPLTLDEVKKYLREDEILPLVGEVPGESFTVRFFWAERLARARRDGTRNLAEALETIGGDGVTMVLNNEPPKAYFRAIVQMVDDCENRALARAVSTLQALLMEAAVRSGMREEDVQKIVDTYCVKLLSKKTTEPQFGQPGGAPPTSSGG